MATLEQARDFYIAGIGGAIFAARPLVLYYSYMNLIKAFCLTRGVRPTFDQSQHGLRERIGPGGKELVDAYLIVERSPNGPGPLRNFAEFMHVLTGNAPGGQVQYDVAPLVAQILSGHRHWAQVTQKQERFISLHDIQFWFNPANRQMWLRLLVFADDLSRLSVTHRRFLSESRLDGLFREVRYDLPDEDRPLVCLEQTQPHQYADYPADHVNQLAAIMKPFVWTTVSTVSPYRRYYAYLRPPAEQTSLVAQLLSIYAVTFYLGSITRYRPHHYDNLIASAWGPRIQDFVTGQPAQFLYLMASEFARRDVTQPSILF